MVERGDWQGAAALNVPPSRFAYVDAITHFARALGAERSGNADAATGDIAKLAELRDKLLQDKDAYWAEIVDIQRQCRGKPGGRAGSDAPMPKTRPKNPS